MSLLVTGRGESGDKNESVTTDILSSFVIWLKYPDWFLLYFHIREVLHCSFYCNLVFLIESFGNKRFFVSCYYIRVFTL